jgi:hypothetical protein
MPERQSLAKLIASRSLRIALAVGEVDGLEQAHNVIVVSLANHMSLIWQTMCQTMYEGPCRH